MCWKPFDQFQRVLRMTASAYGVLCTPKALLPVAPGHTEPVTKEHPVILVSVIRTIKTWQVTCIPTPPAAALRYKALAAVVFSFSVVPWTCLSQVSPYLRACVVGLFFCLHAACLYAACFHAACLVGARGRGYPVVVECAMTTFTLYTDGTCARSFEAVGRGKAANSCRRTIRHFPRTPTPALCVDR